MDTIGKRLKYLRDIEGITQDILAKEIKETRASIANWENDRSEPPASAIVALANFYGVTTDFILGRTSEIIAEEGLLYGLDENDRKILHQQADFYRYRKQLPEDRQTGSPRLTNTGKKGKDYHLKREKSRKTGS